MMTDTIEIITITVLGSLCAFLLGKQIRSGSDDGSEKTPLLLKERESRLEEDASLLREEQAKHQKLEEDFRRRVKQVESQKAKLAQDEELLVDAKKQQEAILATKEKALETRETELKDNIRSFEEEQIVQAKILKDELEERIKDVEVREAKLEKEKSLLREEQGKHQQLKDELTSREERVQEREVKLEKGHQRLEEHRAEHEALKESLLKRIEEIEARELALKVSEAATVVESSTIANDTTPQNETDLKDTDSAANLVEEEKEDASSTPESESLPQEPTQSDAEKRKKMIEDELDQLIKHANETELNEDDPFDEDSVEALKKGAMKICYLKKYYDVMKDELIYFPSVTRTAMDYRLIEAAETFYFEEEDEYPPDLTSALRSVATAVIMKEEDVDFDEEYMSVLAQDVEV